LILSKAQTFLPNENIKNGVSLTLDASKQKIYTVIDGNYHKIC